MRQDVCFSCGLRHALLPLCFSGRALPVGFGKDAREIVLGKRQQSVPQSTQALNKYLRVWLFASLR